MRWAALAVAALLSNVFSQNLWAAACCGGGQGASMVITSDEIYRFRIGQGVTQSSGKTLNFGQAAYADTPLVQAAGSFGAAWAYSDKFQASIDGGWLRNDHDNWGVKDVATSATYVLHRNYLFEPWMPEIFATLGMVWPTGTSFYETRARATDDALYKLKTSLLFSKTNMHWDWSASFSFLKSFERRFESADVSVAKGNALASEFSVGYSPVFEPKLHFGVTQTVYFGAPNVITTTENQKQRSLASYAFPLTLAVAYAWTDNWSTSFSYANSRMFRSQNSELADTLNLQVSYRVL